VIGLDTNVLVRYLTQDDKVQSEAANHIFETQLTSTNPGYVTLITLIELTWVLKTAYIQPKEQVANVISGLLESKQLQIEKADVAYLALKRYLQANADYSDAVITILSKQAGCDTVLTFDNKAKSVGMTLIDLSGSH
jgi:predicted nucleic-acid-binding protein